jgi:hypothetical protein
MHAQASSAYRAAQIPGEKRVISSQIRDAPQ